MIRLAGVSRPDVPMSQVIPFPRPVAQSAPASLAVEPASADDPWLEDAYSAVYAAALRYEGERRRERELRARVERLQRENARLRAELAKR